MERQAMFDVMEFAHLDILHLIMPLSLLQSSGFGLKVA